MKKLIAGVGVALALCWGAGNARAAFDTYTVLGDGGLLGGFSVSLDGNTEAGILVGGIHVIGGGQDLVSLCVDLNGRISLNSTYAFEVTPFAGQTGLNPSWGNPLVTPPSTANALQAVNNAAYLFATYMPSATSALDRAALQLAVWKAIYDTTSDGSIVWGSASRFNVGTDPTAGGAAWAQAQTWLNYGGTFSRTGHNYVGYLLKPDDVNAQELLISAVPETSTVLAGVLVLLPLGLTALRSFRQGRKG